jgi:hypothetical protein
MSRYQVLYIGPAAYDGTPSDVQALHDTVRAFEEEHGNCAGFEVRPSNSLGLFTVRTNNELDADCLPGRFHGFERAYGVLTIEN